MLSDTRHLTCFGSKEGLYVAYIDRTCRELLDRLIAAAAPDDPSLGALRARILEFLAFVEEHRDGWTVLFREITSSRPVAERVADWYVGIVQGTVAAAIPGAAGLILR